MPLSRRQELFEPAGAGCRFLMQDAAGNPVKCFVSREALVQRTARDNADPEATTGPLDVATIQNIFEQYRLEIELIAQTKYESGFP
jgi:hypothetical protein